MRDWLERPGEPASDLDLVVLLLNSLDLLEDPADRLTGLSWFCEVLAAVGRDDIGGALTAGDLPGLRQLRESLRAVFQARSPGEAAALLNPMLVDASAVPQLVTTGDGLRLQVAPRAQGLTALSARLPAALADYIAHRGIGGSAPVRRCPANAPSLTAPGHRHAGSVALPATTGPPRCSTAAGSAPPAEAGGPRPCVAAAGFARAGRLTCPATFRYTFTSVP